MSVCLLTSGPLRLAPAAAAAAAAAAVEVASVSDLSEREKRRKERGKSLAPKFAGLLRNVRHENSSCSYWIRVNKDRFYF